MKTYKLTINPITRQLTDYAMELVDGVPTGVNVNINTNQDYLAWIAQGNQPQEAE